MSKKYRESFLISSALLGSVAIAPSNAIATEPPDRTLEQLQQYSNEARSLQSLDQVTSVSQLRDVQPTDWAFQALQSLVERYGCIAGYPDGTFRGNRPLTRYEFAAGLNACLDRITELIGGEDGLSSEDLATIRRLQEEFQAELATLRGRVDALEARTAELEANQFSTTTKLDGEVIFAASSVFAGEGADGDGVDNVPTFGHRTRLNLETSFTGRDLLLTRLQAGNLDAFSTTGTPEGDLFFADDSENVVNIDALVYYFPVGDNLEVSLIANAGASDDFASTVNPFLDGDGAYGALSRFGTRHPIYYLIEDTGLGLRYYLGDAIEVSLGYMATDADSPLEGQGLFNGPGAAMAQVVLKPSDRLNIGLTYLNAYNTETGTGSNRSNFRSFSEDLFGDAIPTISNAYGVEASWQLADSFALGGWVGYMNTTTLSTLNGTVDRGSLDIWNWSVNATFPDLGGEGNVASIIVGMEPRVTEVSDSLGNRISDDPDTSLHIEGLYQWQVSDNIFITPGVIWLTAPNHDEDNEDIVIGTIRTTFSF